MGKKVPGHLEPSSHSSMRVCYALLRVVIVLANLLGPVCLLRVLEDTLRAKSATKSYVFQEISTKTLFSLSEFSQPFIKREGLIFNHSDPDRERAVCKFAPKNGRES